MAKHRGFKTDKFLKALDPQLRDQFFRARQITIPDNLNFNDGSFDAFWDGIDDDVQARIEEELQCINDTADHSRDCLQDVVRQFNIQTQENETSETTAMRVFLHSDEAFGMALDHYIFYRALSERLSHHKFPPPVTPDFSDARVAVFKTAVEGYYRGEGKSDHCDIRQRIDDGKRVFLIARGDFMKTQLVFDEDRGKTSIRSFRPAREDILIYDPHKHILCLNVDSRTEDKEKYIEMFGKAFLNLDEIDPATLSGTLVDLGPIKSKTFNYQGNDKVEKIFLTEVDVKKRGGSLRLILRGKNLADMDGYGLDSDGTEYVSAKLRFFVRREGLKSRAITVAIKPPENSKIPEKKEKKIVEDYLREQGVMLE